MEKIVLAELRSQGHPAGLESWQGLASNSWGHDKTQPLLDMPLIFCFQNMREREWMSKGEIHCFPSLQSFARASHWLNLTRSLGNVICTVQTTMIQSRAREKWGVDWKKIHSNGNDFAEATPAMDVGTERVTCCSLWMRQEIKWTTPALTKLIV